jgi:hypothetical protein
MSTLTIAIIVFVVFAIIIGNLMMLKSSASQKMPSLKDYEDDIEDDTYPAEKENDKTPPL